MKGDQLEKPFTCQHSHSMHSQRVQHPPKSHILSFQTHICSHKNIQVPFIHLYTIFFIISVKPEIRPIPDNGIIVAESGDTVSLECEVVRGSPTPEVTWRRKERKMPSGEDEIRGLSLTYTSVTRHHSGIYICSADNGFGEPTTAIIKLDVQREYHIKKPCLNLLQPPSLGLGWKLELFGPSFTKPIFIPG